MRIPLPPKTWIRRATLGACALAASVLVSGKAFIIDGTALLPKSLPEVFALSIQGPNHDALCTGFLVHPKLVFTAAHCIPRDPTGVTVTLTNTVNLRRPEWATARAAAVRMGAHAEFFDVNSEDLEKSGYDLGYLVLDREIPATVARPLPLLSVDSDRDRRLLLGKALTTIGYGEFSSDSNRWGSTSGTKRFGMLRVKHATSQLIVTNATSQNIAPGDSGGPATVTVNGKRYVVGIASGSPMLPGRNHRIETSIYTLLRKDLLCWAQQESGIDLGFTCPSSAVTLSNRSTE